MNRYKRLISSIMPLLLCSCGIIDSFMTVNTEPVPDTAPAALSVSADEYAAKGAKREMPLISIVTADSSAGTAFVDEPVNAYVSSQIATWTPGYVIPPAPYYEKCRITVTDTDGSISLADADAEVKVRGNWTTNYDKKPLRIKFAEKQAMVGLNNGSGHKNWVLLAEYKDLSLLRNKAAFELAKEVMVKDGYYSSDCTLAEVEINGEYRGVYLLCEQQETGKTRVDVKEPKKDYTGADIGYFIEYDGYWFNEPPLTGFHIDYADNAPLLAYDGLGGKKTVKPLPDDSDTGFSIKSDIYSQEQHDTIASFVGNVYDIMYAAAYEDRALAMEPDYSGVHEAADMTPEQAVEAVVDVRSLVDMYIMCELTCDADIYWSSFFMSADLSEDGNKKLTFTAPWDFDSALGNKERCVDADKFYAANMVMDVNDQYEAINPWLAVLMYEDWYQDMIRERWSQISASDLPSDTVDMILNDSVICKDAFTRNYTRWNNMRDKSAIVNELNGYTAAVNDQQEAAEQLADWLKNRIAFMDEQWGTK